MYTYDILRDDISYLGYNGAETGSIGSSVLEKNIFYVRIGDGDDKIIITGGIHARENVTCLLVMRQAFALMGEKIPFSIYFVPMIDPDGAALIEKGASAAGKYGEFVRKINGSEDFSLWKANIRGVDLNVNFDAKFGQGKRNVRYPSPQDYIGEYPFSEPETAALRDFTREIKPIFTISYHALGREVYWDFGQNSEKDRIFAHSVANFLGYVAVDGDLSSAGGYKDWCVLNGITALTIEIGKSSLAHPVSAVEAEEDIKLNLDLPRKAYELYNKAFL